MKRLRVSADETGVISFIVEHAKSILDAKGVVLFGSRARGTHHARSDFDFALDFDDESPQDGRWLEFVSYVDENAPTLNKIDLVRMDSDLSSAFKDEIRMTGAVLFLKGGLSIEPQG